MNLLEILIENIKILFQYWTYHVNTIYVRRYDLV